MYVEHGGALVESIALNRRVVGSNPAQAATKRPWASPLPTVACALRRETPIQYPCCGRERLWVVDDLKWRYRNGRMNECVRVCVSRPIFVWFKKQLYTGWQIVTLLQSTTNRNRPMHIKSSCQNRIREWTFVHIIGTVRLCLKEINVFNVRYRTLDI